MFKNCTRLLKITGFRYFSNRVIHEDIINNHVRLNSEVDRIKLMFDAAFGAFKDPHR
jgi:hypothetical protein